MDIGAKYYLQYLSGDDQCVYELVKEYSVGLTLYLNGIVNHIQVAEDLMEETFFKIITKRPKYNGKSSFKTWFYTIGRNIAMDYLRKNKRIVDIPFEHLENHIQEENDLYLQYLKEERKLMVHKALKKINTDYYQVLWLLYFEQLSHEEISMIMKKNSRQITNLVYRAKAALRKEIEKEGFEYEEL